MAGDPTLYEYSLGAPFVVMGSDSIFIGDNLIERNNDYVIDYNKGTIYLARSIGSEDTIRAYYAVVPIKLPPLVQYLPLSPDTVVKATLSESLYKSFGSSDSLNGWLQSKGQQLKFGGSKSLGIRFGSERDLSLDQSLNVMVNGRLGQDLEVNAMLSDQGMPVSGSTQALGQIDKVFIRAKSANWTATVGDYDLSYRRQNLMNVQRQLQGLDAGFNYRSSSTGLSVSSTKGRPGYSRISGRDGIQGPYQLSIKEGPGLFRILANSERVWLDGTLLQKGEDRDYTLDLDRGQITFTPRHVITSDSRITVEFEYSLEGFARSLYFANSELQAGGHMLFSGAYYQETDDAQQPTAGVMDEVWSSILAKAGDDTTKLWGDGGTLADSGTGDYNRTDSVYVYAGRGLGQYSVSFTWVGTGNGDYIYDSISGAYIYAGPGNGDHISLKKYLRPESFRSLGLQFQSQWDGGKFNLNGARTWTDLNLMSDLDDADNDGDGARYDVIWRRDTLEWGGFEVSGRGVLYGTHFNSMLSNPESDFESRWGLGNWANLKGHDPLKGQKSQEYQASYWPSGSVKLGGGWGRLNLLDSLWLRKYQAFSVLKPISELTFKYDYWKTLLGHAWYDSLISSAERQEHRVSADLSPGRYSWQAGASSMLDVSRYRGGALSKARIIQGFLGIARKTQKIDWNSRYSRREDLLNDSLDEAWKGISHTDQVISALRWDAGGGLNVNADHTYLSRVMRPGSAGQGQKSNLAMLGLGYSAFGKSLRAGLDYSLNATEARLLKDYYIKVPDRAGDYSYDSLTGAFYPDTAGNYLKQVLEDGPARRVSEISIRDYLQFSPGQYFSDAWWTGFRLDVSSLSTVKSTGRVTPLLLTTRTSLQSRPDDLSSSMDLSGDLGYYAGSAWNVRLTYRWRRDRDNQALSSAVIRRNNERKGEFGYPINDQARLSLYLSSNISETYGELTGLESSSRPDLAGTEISYAFSRQLESNTKMEAGRERVQRYNLPEPVTNFQNWSASTGLTRKLSLSGQLKAEVGVNYRKTDQNYEDIPMEFRYTRPLNWSKNWRVLYDYRLNNYFTISSSYDGNKEDGKKTAHNGRMEVRAYF